MGYLWGFAQPESLAIQIDANKEITDDPQHCWWSFITDSRMHKYDRLAWRSLGSSVRLYNIRNNFPRRAPTPVTPGSFDKNKIKNMRGF